MADIRERKVSIPVVGILAVLALVLIAVGAYLLFHRNSQLSSQIHDLQGEVKTLQGKTGQAASGQAASTSSLAAQLSAIKQCLPELEQEVNSISYDSNSNSIYPTSQVSQTCNPVLYGSGK